MLAAVGVYVFARISPPELLQPLQSSRPVLAGVSAWFGSAPSFFYTLSVGLLLGAIAASNTGARLHCLVWTGIALGLELTQLTVVADFLTNLLAGPLEGSAWDLVGPYWTRGVFDPLDMMATLAGGLIALAMLGFYERSITDD